MRAAAVALAAIVAVVVAALVASTSAVAGATSWLDEINRYRVAAGLSPVTEQPQWTAGIQAHLRYLASTPQTLMTGEYASAHTENPASPYYTPAGDDEAGSSNLGGGPDDVSAIDGWLTAPFHAIGILRPELTQVAFARDPKKGSAGLDVLHGLEGYGAPRQPVLFPGPGMTTNLTSFGGESPDPLETCGYDRAAVPLIAMLPARPDPQTQARLEGPAGVVTSTGSGLCVVTENNFRTSDAVYGPAGRAIIAGDHAVLVIAKAPLVSGAYTVHVTQPGAAEISWSFTVAAPSTGGSGTRDRPAAQRVCVVPQLRGLPDRLASRLLATRGCIPARITQIASARVPAGRVVATKPAAGARVRAGTLVTLVVSRGRH